ncbi:MAG: sodium/solute symporter [Verrucomicrobiota bacterium]
MNHAFAYTLFVFANITIIDGLIVAFYFALVLSIGVYHSRRKANSDDFISGGRQIPWIAVLGSIVATEVSAATFLAVPGVGYSENMNYLQFGIGSFFARIFIAFVFLGTFYSFRSLTIYDYLATRFGNGTRYTATLFFMVTRLLASAVRLMIAATGLSLTLSVPFTACLVVLTLIAMIYTGGGGIRSIIWTDVLQAFVFIGCGLVLLLYVGQTIGWSEIVDIGAANGRFEVFNLTPAVESPGLSEWFNDSKLLHIAIIFGFLSTAASFGTDQDMTQRMLTCKDVKAARRSVILSGFIAIPIAALFLVVGIALFAYYQLNHDPTLPLNELGVVAGDKVFPHFIGSELPIGLRGLLIVGLLAAAMSSLDSTMGALSSSALVDLYRPIFNKNSGNESLLLNRGFILIAGVLLASVAWALKDQEGFLWLTFKIGSVTYGALLGVFLLGILTNRGSDSGNILSMITGGVICIILLTAIELNYLKLGWSWLILIGTFWTFTLGYFWAKKDPSPEKMTGF